MTLGQRIRAARLEAGLSQRQLCGDEITRNMLSLIENGTATPSVTTLEFLARRLGKPVSFFLEEEAACSPNVRRLELAREAWDRQDWAGVSRALADWQLPDPALERERQLLLALSLCALAREMIGAGKQPYARQLLEDAEKAGAESGYFTPALERERLLLLSQAGAAPGPLAAQLPEDDRELLLRAAAALEDGDWAESGRLLDAAGNRAAPEWCLLRGEVWLAQKEWLRAAECLLPAENAFPHRILPKLERCYRELGDYRKAYEYACRQREIF